MLFNTDQNSNRQPSRRPVMFVRSKKEQQGTVLVLTALMMVFLLAMIAFAVDMGYILNAKTEIQRSVDSGAFAGAGRLIDGVKAAEQEARNYVNKNNVGTHAIADSNIQVEFGNWNDQTSSFQQSKDSPSAVRVSAEQKNMPLFFAKVLGRDRFNIQAEAIAVYQPRDICVVLDYSASMNDDSEFRHISRLGRSAIESNLRTIYQELGSPKFGNMRWSPKYISSSSISKVRKRLGLDKVAYPYPGGSWNDYINYVMTSSYVRNAGYKKRYGYLTLVNYWLERMPTYSQTPDLWQTSEQPITAVKDSVSVFLGYLQQAKTNDRVGLSIYTSENGTGKLEVPLTNEYQIVETISRHRQAGHYDRYTNIGAGMEKARLELESNGRPGALRMMVLMTDGIANRPSSPAKAKKYVLDEARKAADARIPIVTISLGTGADKALMQQVADMTKGTHFNIPGGHSVAQYEKELKEAFKKIASDRPLKLVN